jgi:hypothetical protein
LQCGLVSHMHNGLIFSLSRDLYAFIRLIYTIGNKIGNTIGNNICDAIGNVVGNSACKCVTLKL